MLFIKVIAKIDNVYMPFIGIVLATTGTKLHKENTRILLEMSIYCSV